MGPMYFIKERILEERENRRIFKASPKFIPAGQSTQLIVGATPESDLRILTLSQGLYRRLQMKRVYYSAYMPVVFRPMLPAVEKPPLLRGWAVPGRLAAAILWLFCRRAGGLR